MPVESLGYIIGFAALFVVSVAILFRLATSLVKIIILGALLIFVLSKIPTREVCHSLKNVVPASVTNPFCE